MSMQLDYFYGGEADQFSFYRIPKVLFNGGFYKKMAIEAKFLYGLMLDRMSLSLRNGWLDKMGRVYIYFTMEEAMDMIGFGHSKAVSMFKELETIGLIERKKQGLGKPAIIYVKNFISVCNNDPPRNESSQDFTDVSEMSKSSCDPSGQPVHPPMQAPAQFSHPQVSEAQTSQFRKSEPSAPSFFELGENQTSEIRNDRLPQNGSLVFQNSEANNTEYNNTKINDTEYLS